MAVPMSSASLHEAIIRIGPVLGQFLGQTEAPNVITSMAPADHSTPRGR